MAKTHWHSQPGRPAGEKITSNPTNITQISSDWPNAFKPLETLNQSYTFNPPLSDRQLRVSVAPRTAVTFTTFIRRGQTLGCLCLILTLHSSSICTLVKNLKKVYLLFAIVLTPFTTLTLLTSFLIKLKSNNLGTRISKWWLINELRKESRSPISDGNWRRHTTTPRTATFVRNIPTCPCAKRPEIFFKMTSPIWIARHIPMRELANRPEVACKMTSPGSKLCKKTTCRDRRSRNTQREVPRWTQYFRLPRLVRMSKLGTK